MFWWLIDNFCIVSDGFYVICTKFCGNQFGSYIWCSVSGNFVIIRGYVSAINLVAGKMCLTRLFKVCVNTKIEVKENQKSLLHLSLHL